MRIFDISLTISPDLPVWPGDPNIEIVQIESMDDGAHANVSYLNAGVHIGTHVDAPHHFLNDGRTTEQLPLDRLIGPCYVASLPDEIKTISSVLLDQINIPENVERILFKTSNSFLWSRGETKFNKDFVAISEDGATWLVNHRFKVVGVDYLSVAPFDAPVPTHRILLEEGTLIIEGLDLSGVSQGFYDLYCLPLKLLNSDGAPARVVLIKE